MAVPEIVLIELPSQERRKRNSRHQTLAGVDFFFVRSGGLVDVSTIFPFSFKIMWRLLPGTGAALLPLCCIAHSIAWPTGDGLVGSLQVTIKTNLLMDS